MIRRALAALIAASASRRRGGAERRRDRAHDAPRDPVHGRAGRDQRRLCLVLSSRHVAPLGRDRGAPIDDLGAAARHGDDGPPLPRRLSRDRRRILLPRRGGRRRRADRRPAPQRRLELFHRLRRAGIDALMVPDDRPQRLADGGIPALCRQRHVRRCRHVGGDAAAAQDLSREEATGNTARRSTGRSPSSSTANIRTAAGRSAGRMSGIIPLMRGSSPSTTMSPRRISASC